MNRGMKVFSGLMVAALVVVVSVGAVLAQGPGGRDGGKGIRNLMGQGHSSAYGFVDEDGDGVHDLIGEGHRSFYGFVDEDGDGVHDGCDGNCVDEDGDGVCDNCDGNFVDEDGDGVCDTCGGVPGTGYRGRGRRAR